MYVNPKVFKAYDIRGDFPEEVNGRSVYVIMRAFVELLRSREPKQPKFRIVVANDGRPSSPELKKAAHEALLDEGVTLIDIGFATTPFYYYTVFKTEADGGVMITASHAPQRMNGLKLTTRGAEPLVGEGMEIVKSIARRGIFQSKAEERGTVEHQSLYRDYVDFLLSKVDLSKAGGVKVVFDAGGGMAGVLLPHLIKRLPCETTILGGEMTYASAFKVLNPLIEEDLAPLKNEVLLKRAAFGVAFDQDSDRSGFVTNNARYFRSDYVGAFLAREFLKTNPGVPMVHDVRSSSIFRETIVANGGRPLESRVGHSFIKTLMRKEDAFFAAEMSGHFYFKEFNYLDSDLLPFLYFLQFLSRSTKTSDQILSEFNIYPSSGEINFKVEGKDTILEQIASKFSDAKETKWVDGLTLYYDDWWANIRLSNTEALLRLTVEARTQEILEEKVKALSAVIEA